MATSQFQNRGRDVGRGAGMGFSGSVGNDASSGNSYFIIGMVFFGVVSFITLPISVFILMDAKKTNANSHAALAETKKIQAELKSKKEEDDE